MRRARQGSKLWEALRAAAAAAPAGQLQPPTVPTAAPLPHLGWRLPGSPRPILLAALTVRDATSLLTAPAATQRATQYLSAFACTAARAPPLSPAPLVELQAAMARKTQEMPEQRRGGEGQAG